MQPIRYQAAPIKRLTNDATHSFFGYYDLQPWSEDSRHHLCHRVPFMDRLPGPEDRAELGMITLHDQQFVPLAETLAWNFQQGAMLQWNPRNPLEEILYNTRRNGAFEAAIKNIRTGDTRYFGRPFANVSTDGDKALSVNFSRMLDFRPGYGYEGIPDPFAYVPAPADDGIYLIDLINGKETLILSLAAISDLFVSHFGEHMRGAKLLINHITFNPSASRFLFLARSMPMPGTECKGWLTMTGTADCNGKHVHLFNGHGGASHYWWRDDQHLLIYADTPGDMQLCLLTDQTQQCEVIDPDFFTYDGHCSYSPDQSLILYDSYPDRGSYRKLLVYDLAARKGTLLAELYSTPTPSTDGRCDLHPRWNQDGSAISFDSTHEQHRHIYTMRLDDVPGLKK